LLATTTQRYYDIIQRLGTSFTINPSWYLWVLFRIIKPLIDPVTASKINFVDLNNQNHKSTESDLQGVGKYLSILDYIDSDQLLTEYGGNVDMPWDFESYWNELSRI
jgi:hypothetical protein